MVDKVILPLLPESEKKKVKDIMESDKQIYEKMQEVQEVVEDYSSSLTGDAKEEFDKNLMEKMIDVQNEISWKCRRLGFWRANLFCKVYRRQSVYGYIQEN